MLVEMEDENGIYLQTCLLNNCVPLRTWVVLEQHGIIALSGTREMFYICTVQNGIHQKHVAIEHLNCGKND